MTYSETLDYLFSQLPMYQRQGAPAFKKDLSNTLKLCGVLGNPQNSFNSVHVAGTNGKGSVSHMLASIFQAAGYKTGLYTSPHLKDFRERIRINGNMIPEGTVVDFVAENQPIFETIKPSFFEMTVALAFDHFAKNEVDIAIIEVGLGGRLDSTNIITPELSVITNIGYDHQQFLGETLVEIASEKAGIIKSGVPVVIGELQNEVKHVFEQKANERGSTLLFANSQLQVLGQELKNSFLRFRIQQPDGVLLDIESQLIGPHQFKNLPTVVASIQILKKHGWKISEQDLKDGIRTVIDKTGLLGRWQTLQRNPLIICDTAHNKEGFVPNLERLLSMKKAKQLHFVWGMVNDKDIEATLRLLPMEATYYFCKPDIPRGLDASLLHSVAQTTGLKGEHYSSVAKAIEASKQAAGMNDVIYIGGSTFVVAEVV